MVSGKVTGLLFLSCHPTNVCFDSDGGGGVSVTTVPHTKIGLPAFCERPHGNIPGYALKFISGVPTGVDSGIHDSSSVELDAKIAMGTIKTPNIRRIEHTAKHAKCLKF